MNRFFSGSLVLAAAFFLAAQSLHASDQITTYTVPKETPPPANPADAAASVSAAPDNASMAAGKVPMGDPGATIQYQMPQGWTATKPSGVRVASFAVAPGVSMDVTHFPGDVGGELANVNRWRRQLGLPEVTEPEISSEPVTADSETGKLYDLSGATNETIVADVPHRGESWFFKLSGAKPGVAAARPAFLAFLTSVKFGENENAAATASIQPNVAASLPANWREKSPGAMILRAYSVGDDSAPANVTVSSFPGVMGGVLANVNRWRRQLQLGEISAEALPSATQALNANGVSATMIDFIGTDAQTSKPARMIAAIVPRGDQTWFYKMLGDPATVGHEKEPFVKYVQTVQEQ